MKILTNNNLNVVTTKYIDDVTIIMIDFSFEKNNRKLFILQEKIFD